MKKFYRMQQNTLTELNIRNHTFCLVQRIRWKDENSKMGPIRQFVGIRAKMYSIRCDNKKFNKLKVKGIVKVSYDTDIF